MTNFAQSTLRVLSAVIFASLTTASFAATFVSVTVAPPPLPVYAQPVAPGAGYIWTPGYWAYGPEGYFWVPGTWVIAPFAGALWTPGYWAWGNGVYGWRAGYWGPRVGFYGGVNYGFGYTGVGYHGGYWNNGAFYYNRAVNNVNVTSVHNTYNTTIINNNVTRRVSYNGGTGGLKAQPTAAEQSVAAEQHTPAIAAQQEHEQAAAGNRAQLASANHGRPPIAATPQPGAFDHPGAVAAGTHPNRNAQLESGVRPQAANHSMPAAAPNGHVVAGSDTGHGQSHPQGQAHASHAAHEAHAESRGEGQHPR